MFLNFFRILEDALAVAQTDNEQMEQQVRELKDRLKNITKSKLIDGIMGKKDADTKTVSSKQQNIFIVLYFNSIIQIQRPMVELLLDINHHYIKVLQLMNKK